jgi:HEAT repeat protein
VDEVETLIQAFESRGKRDQSLWKLDILLDLGRLVDPRVVRFLAAIATDGDEPLDVRIEALSCLRETAQSPSDRALAASAGLATLTDASDSRIRLRAAIVLGDFVDVDGVLSALGVLAAAESEPTELRYNAYTSLQRAGPTTSCVAIPRSLSSDETFGQSARSLLAAWGVR